MTNSTPNWVLIMSCDCQVTSYIYCILSRGDHTTASCNLFIVPPHTEAAVFSMDGALASNFSLSAKDMRMKQGAVETVRCVCVCGWVGGCGVCGVGVSMCVCVGGWVWSMWGWCEHVCMCVGDWCLSVV